MLFIGGTIVCQAFFINRRASNRKGEGRRVEKHRKKKRKWGESAREEEREHRKIYMRRRIEK